MRIAIIGGGISGLGCAHALARDGAHRVALFEAEPRFGGHANTVDVALDGIEFPVDTGFLVYNERTYPHLIALFDELAVPVADSDMSFGASIARADGSRLEWAGTDLDSVFAQRRNLASPAFLSMLADVLRFNREATALARGAGASLERTTLGELLQRSRYGRAFVDWYLLPMAGAIWSCPLATMLDYPAAAFVRFFHNHGLLQIANRPRWFTVRGGSRQYVQRITAKLRRAGAELHAGEPVLRVTRHAGGGVLVHTPRGAESFDEAVLACHSDQALRLLADADPEQQALLRAVRYQPNRALLHTDAALMPRSRKAWSSWNAISHAGAQSVTYWLNRLQPLPFRTPLFVSLNPAADPAPAAVLAEFQYAHPVFDRAAIDAQRRLPSLQGRHGVWFAGAWTGYGFHEDGLKSGLAVAHALLAREAAPRATPAPDHVERRAA